MSSWKALNVESDNEEEDEIDDTKEIQIEEALKLYQTALKLHSEGPQSFEKTAEAYKALFESEIFKYPESFSEYKRHELYGDTLVFDTILQDDFDAGPVQSAGGNESAPNTLPQILHLSYKNHGQFLLETMQHWIRRHGAIPYEQGSSHVTGILTYFAEALDKEDTDLDLWLRTASVAAMLGSKRITRFCLEAVLDGNDELHATLLRLPSLEEGFAGQQLHELVAKLEDKLSLDQPPFSNMKRKKLSGIFTKRLNPYPSAPLPAENAAPAISKTSSRAPEHVILDPTKWDWAGVGDAILRHYMAEQSGLTDNVKPGSGITFRIPPDASPVEINESAVAPASGESLDGHSKEPSQPETEDFVTPPTKASESPAKHGEDVAMMDQDRSTTGKAERSVTPAEPAQPRSRKRSTDSAGLPETAEGGRIRSKRIRAREVTDGSTGTDSAGQEAAKQLDDLLWPYTHADQCLCEVVNDIFARLGVESLGNPKELRDVVTNCSSERTATDSLDKAACDMYTALQTSGAKIAPVLLSTEPVDLGGASREAGLNAFLGHSKTSSAQACVKPTLHSEKLTTFIRNINNSWLSTKEVAFAWMEALLSPGFLPVPDESEQSKSSYMQFRWTEDLKRHLVQVIVNIDDFIYQRMLDRFEELNNKILKARAQWEEYQLSESDAVQIETVEILFELHLDIYSLIKHPHSGVDAGTQTVQSDRLERWASLAREAMQLRTHYDPDAGLDDLALRHIWASVFQMNVNEDVLPEHVIYAMEELKAIFQSLDGRTIEVQNNAVMPELSVAAVDRELVRISMKDFFLKVFDTDDKDPVTVIESLEPLLEPLQEMSSSENGGSNGDGRACVESQSPSTVADADTSTELQVARPSPSQEMRKFLDSASVNLRLSLWQRLREAYEAIEYPPKVLSCYLRSIETLVGEFRTLTYQECSIPERHVKLISRLRIVDEVAVKVLQIIRGEKTAFECLSYEHMQSTMSAISQLLRIMSAANFLQDTMRIAPVISIPRYEGLPASTFVNMMTRLNDMQLRLWMLQYYLLKEGISQNAKEFPVPSDDLFEFLRHVHHAAGVRNFCHLAGRTFLRLAKDEILRLDDVTEISNRETELCQVLYDLYGLKTFIDPLECQEFSSVPDILDKKTATNLLPFILSQAAKINIKDLPKHDLKATIEKVHGALGRPRSNEDISLNGKIIKAFFKSPINPISLFNCLKGIGSLHTKHIPPEVAIPASKGWYFLMGNIALNKFRSQKRTGQGPTEDINFAQAFFLQDIEYSIDRWETWYRLAQANDTLLEEFVAWNADKMNSNSVELTNIQRTAINCYTMAVACAVRDADPDPQTRMKVAKLYKDFGNRMYASSREPFSMNAFTIKDAEQKYYSGNITQIVYQNVPFSPLTTYTAWKISSVLFKRASKADPDQWWNYYMLGKSLWKMYCANADAEGPPPGKNGPSWEEVIKAIVNAIETLPEKKERGREPILEPHYKLVSIVHKLFQRRAIGYEKGEELLKHTPFSHNLSSPGSADDWERYVIAVLKALRAADKSSWHHRIIARAAHVIYDDSTDMMVALAAKHELTQQTFTKTMAINVWKPENERPGRHFVYTTRYTRFFIHLLDQTGDKANLELLAKRVRRKQTDFFEHSKLWQELCLRYLKLLRRTGKIPDGHEDTATRSLNYDEFNVQAARLEAWCQDPSTQHPVLDILRDVVDLKRLNNGLMKAVLIDDLLGDTYALLYTTIAPSLPPLPSEQTQAQPVANAMGQQVTGPTISSLVKMQVDGASEHQNSPFALYHPSQLQQQPQPADPVSKPRAKTVGRREIQRRAEACAQKPAGVAAPTPTAIPIRSPPVAAHATLALAPRLSPEKATAGPSVITSANEQLQVPNSGTATAAASVTNVESSAPASVHDDADDESELSELDESEMQEIGQEVAEELERPRSISVTSRRSSAFPHSAAHKETAKEQMQSTADSSHSGGEKAA